MKKHERASGPHSLPFVIMNDILITALALVVFAYFHHVRPSVYSDLGIVSYRRTAPAVQTTPAPKPTASPLPTEGAASDSAAETGLPTNATVSPSERAAEASLAPRLEAESASEPGNPSETEPENTAASDADTGLEPEPVQVAEGDFSLLHADKFIDGDPIETVSEDEYRYVSRNVNISVTSSKYKTGEYMLADIYVRDITNIATAFAEDKFGKGIHEWTQDIGARYGAILAINGDYCGSRENGAVIRNGVLYRERHSNLDVCVLYWDGTMKTFSPATSDARKAMEDGAYQAWSFGPMLLDDDGQPLSSFNSNVNKYNPRTAIGYYEPGHYCFLVVRGRASDSRGLKMEDLAQLMCDLGCKVAYNLDGGKSSVMAWRDQVINDPYEGGRRCSDIVMIVD